MRRDDTDVPPNFTTTHGAGEVGDDMTKDETTTATTRGAAGWLEEVTEQQLMLLCYNRVRSPQLGGF